RAGGRGARPRGQRRAGRDPDPGLQRRRGAPARVRGRRHGSAPAFRPQRRALARHLQREPPRGAQAPDGARMNITLSQAGHAGGTSTGVQILLLMTLLSVLPGLLLVTTGFTRILIVLGFVRNALGTQQMPPNQVLVGIAFFLSLFVMSP